MILEYKKTSKDIMNGLNLYDDLTYKTIKLPKSLIKSLFWINLKVKKIDKEITKVSVLEDKLEINRGSEKNTLNFKEIEKIDRRKGFIALISDGEIVFIIHEKHFKNIEEKNKFLKIIIEKTAKNSNESFTYKGLLNNESNYEELTEEQKENNFLTYEIGNKSYRILMGGALIENKKKKFIRGLGFINILIALIIVLADKMGLIEESFNFILTNFILILSIITLTIAISIRRGPKKKIKKIKEKLSGEKVKIKILKINDGIIYNFNDTEEFIPMDKIEKIEKQKNIFLIKIKNLEIPILLVNFESKKIERLINEIKKSMKEN